MVKINVKWEGKEYCKYCQKDIDITTYGWGYMFDEDNKSLFHTECMEVTEGVKLG
jgi:hypothetical protein